MPYTSAIADSDRVAYTIPQVAELLYVSTRQVFRLLKDGRLKASKVGGRTLILRAGVERLLAGEPVDGGAQ